MCTMQCAHKLSIVLIYILIFELKNHNYVFYMF